MRKTNNVFFLKKPNKWEFCHLVDMISAYREDGVKIRVFKDIEKNSYILIYSIFTVNFDNLRDLCELLFPYYESIMNNKKKSLIDNYFERKFKEEFDYGKFRLTCK